MTDEPTVVSGLRLADRSGRTTRFGTWWSATSAAGAPRGALLLDPAHGSGPALDRVVAQVVAVRALALPGVLPVLDLVTEAGRVWLVTAEPAVPTVAELLGTDSAHDADDAIAVALWTGQTLLGLHAAGLSHGDFGAQNVVLTAAGAAAMVEVGLAEDDPAGDVRAWSALLRVLAARWGDPGLTGAAAVAGRLGLAAALDALAGEEPTPAPDPAGAEPTVHIGTSQTVRLDAAAMGRTPGAPVPPGPAPAGHPGAAGTGTNPPPGPAVAPTVPVPPAPTPVPMQVPGPPQAGAEATMRFGPAPARPAGQPPGPVEPPTARIAVPPPAPPGPAPAWAPLPNPAERPTGPMGQPTGPTTAPTGPVAAATARIPVPPPPGPSPADVPTGAMEPPTGVRPGHHLPVRRPGGPDPADQATRMGERSTGAAPAPDGSDVRLRFGTGVPAPVEEVWRAGPPAAGKPRRRWRRVVGGLVSGAIIGGVVGYFWWANTHPLHLTGAQVAPATPPGTACDVTVDVVGTVATNGRPGTITYQWLRSDGEATQELTQSVSSGTRSVPLHLHWKFSGKGSYNARATLKVLGPDPLVATGEFVYTCR